MQSFWRRCRRRLRALSLFSWNDRVLSLESLAMLAAARLLVKTTSAERFTARMGGATVSGIPSSGGNVTNGSTMTPDGCQAVRVGAMLERVARVTWWRSLCLEKAIAGRWMLRRRGIASTIYVGMAKSAQGFVAHAWLVGEGQTVTGAGDTTYATLAAFSESAR